MLAYATRLEGRIIRRDDCCRYVEYSKMSPRTLLHSTVVPQYPTHFSFQSKQSTPDKVAARFSQWHPSWRVPHPLHLDKGKLLQERTTFCSKGPETQGLAA